jgi:hypothetical protein
MPEDNGNTMNHALPLIFDRSHTEGLSTVYRTFMQYHRKEVDFMDEVKIALPLNIGPRAHLLFTFLHVSLKCIHDFSKKNLDRDRVVGFFFFLNYFKCFIYRNILGYAILPLKDPTTENLLVLMREEFSLRIATKLVPDYFKFILSDTQVFYIVFIFFSLIMKRIQDINIRVLKIRFH